jgi:hypothetical protein
MPLTFRELRPDEFERIPPEALGGLVILPGQARITAALEEDEIVGIWSVAFVLHAEPVWVREDHRRHPTLLRRLWDGVTDIVRDIGAKGVVGVIPDSVPADKRIAEWIGAEPIPGAIYLWLDKEK